MVFHSVTRGYTEYRVLYVVTQGYMVLIGGERVRQGVTRCYRVLLSLTGCHKLLQGDTWC